MSDTVTQPSERCLEVGGGLAEVNGADTRAFREGRCAQEIESVFEVLFVDVNDIGVQRFPFVCDARCSAEI